MSTRPKSDNAENAGYGTGVGKESKIKIGLANVAHKNSEFERETKNYEFRKEKFQIKKSKSKGNTGKSRPYFGGRQCLRPANKGVE